MINKQSYQITGMRPDNLVGTGASSKFAHEIMNLRLNTIGDYTTASWTTEQGTLSKPVEWDGNTSSKALELLSSNNYNIIPIGQAVINDQWIVFATQSLDEEHIQGIDLIFKYYYRQDSDQLCGTILYAGYLNFDAKHPCETLVFYENDDVQKVYWTDGKNQPRVINIANTKYHTDLDGQFDFVQEVELKEKVTINKLTSGAGMFPPGTVKYAITYYKKYGQETNIVYDSPLYYPIKGQRGCSPDELSGDSFEIKVENVDTTHGFDYIRLYSIVRTSEDATPIVRIVDDKEIVSLPIDTTNPNNPKYALFTDTNTTGEIVDSTILQYVGGNEVVVQTLDQKNNTLFLGNVELKQKSATKILEEISLNSDNDNNTNFYRGDYNCFVEIYNNGGYRFLSETNDEFAKKFEKAIGIRVNTNNQDKSFYQYDNQMTANKHWHNYTDDGGTTDREHNGNSQRIKIFKYGEYYRFGIQFQNKKGSWSEVIYLKTVQNKIKPKTDKDSSVGIFGVFKYQLPNAAVTKLLDNNYIKARLVCCYTNNADRTVLTQGIINPTIYNDFWNDDHAPDNMSSWFFRPNDRGNDTTTLPFRHQAALKRNQNKDGEIQSIDENDDTKKSWFYCNQDVLTLHSPEITFDESIRTLSLDKVTINPIGHISINSWAAATYVEATSPYISYFGYQGPGLENATGVQTFSANKGSHFVGQGVWRDRDYYKWDQNNRGETINYPLYAFHRKGSLADYVKDIDSFRVTNANANDVVTYPVKNGSVLESKCLSHLIYSANTLYQDTEWSPIIEQSALDIYDTNEPLPLRLSNGNIYYGNLDTIAPVPNNSEEFRIYEKCVPQPWPLEDIEKYYLAVGKYQIYGWNAANDLSRHSNGLWVSDPVPITYNSTAHGVFTSKFGTNGTYLNLLSNIEYPYLYLVDVTRNIQNRFGGEPSTNNIYIPCGPVIDLRECQNSSPILVGIEGDHYYMRYDCLKTYPRSTDDVNQIVEILSFMCETRINLDGRYDKNRGLSDNTIIGTENFNLINKSYTQSNNFFTYNTLEDQEAKLDKFANLITWTKDKVSGENVDTWTNITMASTADAEGTCGRLNKIININDTLYCFQDHGIAQIGYNEKTALSTEAGIPLEIATSGKYSGLKYISKEVGCQNKWSISSTKNGAFFIDDSRQELLTLNQELTSLSTTNGFDAFFVQQLPDSEHFTPWTPYEPNNFVSYYDKLGNDIFYINKDYCLAWNEQSKTFTSFYSYNNVPLMANIGTHLLMWDINTQLAFDIVSQEVTETITTYIPVTTTTTETIEHPVVLDPEDYEIYTNEKQLTATIYLFVKARKAGTGISINSWPPVGNGSLSPDYGNRCLFIQDNQFTTSINNSWGRFVVQPSNYILNGRINPNYLWNAHYIISLEFYKNYEPFIIQFEVQGTHGRTLNSNYCNWDNDLTVKLRATNNVTTTELNRLKCYVGGKLLPTLNFGNIKWEGQSYAGYDGKFSPNGTQPWANTDSSYTVFNVACRYWGDTIINANLDVKCIVKIYDLTYVDGHSDNPIIALENGYTQIFTSELYKYDYKANKVIDDITDIIPQAEPVQEIIEHTTTTYEPVETTVTSNQYVIKSASSNIWAARENPNYCEFFNSYKPYWMTIVCDGQTDKGSAFPADKVFNNIEFRADVFDRNYDIADNPHTNYNTPVFNLKQVWNGYQNSGDAPLDGIRKFNTWRVQLPRHQGTRDRIRNPFCYIKLKQDQTISQQTDRMILHDLAVYFDMR